MASLNSHQRTPLHLAVQAGSLETVRLLLSPMLPNTLEIKDADGNTPLHIACWLNRLEILRFFLDQGADVTALNNENKTCLDVAIEWDSVEVVKTLVKHERYVNVRTVPPYNSFTMIYFIIRCIFPSLMVCPCLVPSKLKPCSCVKNGRLLPCAVRE